MNQINTKMDKYLTTEIYNKLMRRALFLTKKKQSAEDLLHDTLMKAILHIDKFDGQHFYAWICLMMFRILINHKDKLKRIQAMKERYIYFKTGQKFGTAENVGPLYPHYTSPFIYDEEQFVRDQVKKVKFKGNKKLFLDVIFSGHNFEEVARINDVSVGTVKSTMSRMSRKIENRIKEIV